MCTGIDVLTRQGVVGYGKFTDGRMIHPYPAYKPSGVQWLGDVPDALGTGP